LMFAVVQKTWEKDVDDELARDNERIKE
jgi:hypothetical protein